MVRAEHQGRASMTELPWFYEERERNTELLVFLQ